MTETLHYLSDRWLAEADRAASQLTVDGEAVTIAMAVVGGPGGDRRYRLVLEPPELHIRPGHGNGNDDRTVTMTMDHATAVGIARGASSAQRAFLDGRIRLGGDVSLLLGDSAVRALSAATDCFAGLRDRTDFGPSSQSASGPGSDRSHDQEG